VTERKAPRVGLAIVRAVVEGDEQPIIRILRMDDLFREERVLGTTVSPDEAAAMIRDWLSGVIERRERARQTNDNGPVTPE
jgi:hypothetical protein